MVSKGGFLESKNIPRSRAAGAVLLALLVASVLWFWVHKASLILESYFDSKANLLVVWLCIMSYPLSGIIALILLIPIGVYVLDHAPYQSLVLPRPDHYAILVSRVFRSWMGAGNGKLAAKDM